MPELPDVEVFRRYLDEHALHQAIAHVQVRQPYVLADVSPEFLSQRLGGGSFTGTRRHGKNLFVAIAPAEVWLLLHFGMTGRLVYLETDADEPAHTSVRFDFDGGLTLAHVDQRKLGKVGLVADVEVFLAEHQLGPDALELDRERLAGLTAGRRSTLKAWLMDQKTLAGVGNVYADEILFHARLAPTTRVDRLDEPALTRLHEALQGVLRGAIDSGADPARMPADWLLPRRKPGAACPRCGTPLVHHSVAGRTTWNCPACQRAAGG